MLVQSALDGYPVCIFAYGQTGSGKTFTMEGGPGGDPQMEGLIPRALRHLFSVAQELSGQGWTYSFVASYVEIYNETVRDLLATGTRKGQGGECEIRRAGPGSEELTVTNARYVPVSCEREVSAEIKRLFSPSSLSAIMLVSSAYRRLLIFLPAILIPACASSSPAFS